MKEAERPEMNETSETLHVIKQALCTQSFVITISRRFAYQIADQGVVSTLVSAVSACKDFCCMITIKDWVCVDNLNQATQTFKIWRTRSVNCLQVYFCCL